MRGENADVCHSLCMLVEAVAEGVLLHASSRRMYVLLPQDGYPQGNHGYHGYTLVW